MTTAPTGPGAGPGTEIRTPVLELAGIVKSYGQVQALRGAALTVYPGEVVALVGDNGAGKSTTVKVISGVVQPDAGEIRVDGQPVTIPDPVAARRLGIETVYQDLALAPDLDPAENLFLGREIVRPGLLGKLGFLDRRAMRAKADEAFGSLGVGIQDTSAQVVTMSGGQRQGIAVGRAVNWADRVLLMDEPTAALGVVQTERVGQLIQRVRASGVAVVLISHNLPFVFEYADRIEVLRLGQRVARLAGPTATSENVLGAMTGALTFEDSSETAEVQS
ncbi:ATP-binding cassette domain-containing protein [Streptomyces sp. NBC_01537]|uniref:ATP-binding cassette domain-containing protein n=1 Tax=Streptomyces sp. NBC_01537 TaxID=2903896 RepID=UPI003863650D